MREWEKRPVKCAGVEEEQNSGHGRCSSGEGARAWRWFGLVGQDDGCSVDMGEDEGGGAL